MDMDVTILDLSGRREQVIALHHDRNGRPQIFANFPRLGLINRDQAYTFARALVDMADELPHN